MGKPILTASGSTAQANAVTRFVDAYRKACPGQTLNYTANGSGAGISDFLAGRTDFGSSDSPPTGDQYAATKQRCGGSEAWNLPVMFGGGQARLIRWASVARERQREFLLHVLVRRAGNLDRDVCDRSAGEREWCFVTPRHR